MTKFATPKFVYLNYSLQDGEDYIDFYSKIKKDLLETFGPDCDPRYGDSLTTRWSEGFMSVLDGCPKGLYFRDSDDLLLFMLKYPESSIR